MAKIDNVCKSMFYDGTSHTDLFVWNFIHEIDVLIKSFSSSNRTYMLIQHTHLKFFPST